MKFTQDEKKEITLIVISTLSLVASYYLSLEYIAGISVILCGIPIFKECIEGLIKEFDIKTDLLVTIAIISSIIIGEVFAAGEIATIMAIGGFLEQYTVSKTHRRIEKLVNATPQFATRIKKGNEEKIPVEEVKVGDVLKVLPGENIPTDGIIINGETSIDQSTLTGESLPVDKKVNDEVYSGTINVYGSFTMETTKESKDSSLQKLITLVESSKPENAEIVKTADKWAALIVVIAFIASILTYLITFEIIRSVTILVVFCPCALVLATPTAIMAAIGNLTKHGILVKEGQSIEELAHIDELVFDKTGTLTYGTPEVAEVISESPEEMMYLLASLESKSEHPIAKSIMKHYNSNELAEVKNFKIDIGKGITGEIRGFKILAGNRKHLKQSNIKLKYNEMPKNGETEIFVVKESEVLGKVLLADTLRENIKETIWTLKDLRVRTTLLTGDNKKTAEHIAKLIKIRNIKANCLPEDKVEYIKGEQLKGNRIAMIGDGLNDAPSLKKANVGIAMSEIGSDISVEASNISLINDNITEIPHLIGLARKTIKTINICIGFALILNAIAMGLAIMGILNPIEGALIHNIGSVIVVLYSTNLVRYRFPRKNINNHKKLGLTKNIYNQIT
ncbi:heavy metal translocating P-type ATPase [Methanobrevibacter sp.]|uniref:heavy metal translocating P-type ATPase n=1 Tax=Methanobrevibacter sp. TaxID=66852 RepID=UPI00388FCF5C